MDDSKTPELTVDCEFRDLIRPLLKDEYRHLEAALLADGCREPITVWKGIIVDGHNRYEICRRLGIPFEVRERHFDNREEAIIWICANQLGRRNISDETRRYLIGKRYEAEKVIAGRRNYSGWNQYRKREQSGDLPYEVIEPDAQQERIRTSQRIGEEYHLAHGTVEKYGAYSKAVDQIAKKDPSMLPRILSGRYKISHENVHCMMLGFTKNLVLPLPEPPMTSTFLLRAYCGFLGRLFIVRRSVFVRITLFHGSGSMNG